MFELFQWKFYEIIWNLLRFCYKKVSISMEKINVYGFFGVSIGVICYMKNIRVYIAT